MAAQQRRQGWQEEIQALDPSCLVFLDESGMTTQMTRLYGRALGGERVGEATPQSHWRTLTVLGVITTQGVLASMTIAEATDGDIFLAYLEHALCPKLQARQVVIMDNLRAHKVAGVRDKIEACGARLVYLSPYSPDLNPIEPIWAKVKQTAASLVAQYRNRSSGNAPVMRRDPAFFLSTVVDWMSNRLNLICSML